jgi:hypothetical protein
MLRRPEPCTFRHVGTTVIQVQFKGEGEAIAFAQTFSGELV